MTLDVRGTSLLCLHGVFLEGEDDCHVGDAAWGDARVDKWPRWAALPPDVEHGSKREQLTGK